MTQEAHPAREAARDTGAWILLVALGLALSAIAVAAHARVGTASAPFTGAFRLKLEPGSLLAPAVAGVVLVGARAGWTARLGWRRLLGLSYVLTVCWGVALALVDGGNGLATPVDNAAEYLHDLPSVGSDPIGFIRTFVDQSAGYSVATRTHPPAPVLLLWVLHKLGIARPSTYGLVLTLIGALSVPLVAIAMRSLCHEPAARRLLPVLVLAPYAVWMVVSMDAVTTTLCAGFVTAGVIASEHGRRGWNQVRWGTLAGLLLGTAALFGYAVAWLGASVIMVYFVRRRPLLNLVTGLGCLVPLAVFRAWGFVWPDGLTSAQTDLSLRVGPQRSWALWAILDLVLLVVATGPAIVTAARRVRLTPGWPFLVGGLLAVGFAIASGLSRGEVERSWLPFFPWLLVPCVAPLRRPDPQSAGDETAGPLPLLQTAVGALAAIVIEAVLRTAW